MSSSGAGRWIKLPLNRATLSLCSLYAKLIALYLAYRQQSEIYFLLKLCREICIYYTEICRIILCCLTFMELATCKYMNNTAQNLSNHINIFSRSALPLSERTFVTLFLKQLFFYFCWHLVRKVLMQFYYQRSL